MVISYGLWENETVKNCHQLKLKTVNDKYRLIDVVDIESMFQLKKNETVTNCNQLKLKSLGGKYWR